MTAKRVSWIEHARSRLVQSLLAAAGGFPRPGEDHERAVHEARKELKRSGSLTRLFAPIVGAPAYDALDAINGARRAIGRARDLDVLPLALAGVKCDSRARDILINAIEAEREKARGAHAALDASALAANLTAAAESAAGWTLADAADASLAASLRHTYRSAKRRGRVAFTHGDAEHLHELRVRVVDLGLQLNVFESAWGALIAAEVGELHKLRGALGDHNDLTVLGEFVLSRRELTPAAAESVVAAVLRRRKPLERRAREQFERLFAERPRAFERRVEAYLTYPQKRP